MKASIVGCGKMGQEIIGIFLESDIEIVWLGRNQDKLEEYNRIIRKKLKRLARKNGWSQEQIEERQSKVLASVSEDDLQGSDVVIETVVEEITVKQDLFARIEKLVSAECILLTNTSSLPLTLVFEKVENKKRCSGLHFFYPSTMIPSVEINYFSQTCSETVKFVEKIMQGLGRNYIKLSQEVNMLFSKFILILMSEAYNMCSEKVTNHENINQIIKESFMMMGIFDILNSTGNKIVFNCVCNFIDPKNEHFFEKFKNLITDIHVNYQDCIYDEYCEAIFVETNTGNSEIEDDVKQLILHRFECLYLNYCSFLVNNKLVDKNELLTACKDILGITKTPSEILNELGTDMINNIIENEYHTYPSEMFKLCDYSIWNK